MQDEDEPDLVDERSHVIRIWHADLGDWHPDLARLLERRELVRCLGFRQQQDRRRMVMGIGLARLALAHDLSVPLHRCRLSRTCPRCGASHGKPQVSGADGHVSIAHSGELVVVATTGHHPLGVDVQEIPADVSGLASAFLEGRQPSKAAEAITVWCRKESAVKATGDGLLVPLDQVVVTAAHEPARLVSYLGRPLAAFVCDLPIRVGYRAAVTVLSEQPKTVALFDGGRLVRGWTTSTERSKDACLA